MGFLKGWLIHENREKSFNITSDEMWLEFPEGRFPLKIHKDKRANAFYIKIQTRENMRKLFHYFYDDVDESMYLTRKYNVFVKGLNLEKKEKTEQLTLDLGF